MIKKTITYEGFDGKTYTEDFYFNLNKAELAELEMTAQGGDGLHAMLRRVIASKDNQVIVDTFKKIMRKSYGRRTEDGKSFIKKDEFWETFETSNAYGELFVELITNAEIAADFIVGLVPTNLADKIDKSALQTGEVKAAEERDPSIYTREELLALPADEFTKLLKKYKGKTTPSNILQAGMARLGA